VKILMASPEAVPYAKTGGLADVAGALPGEFLRQRIEKIKIMLVLPLYKKIKAGFELENTGKNFSIKIGDKSYKGSIHKNEYAFFIGCDEFFARDELYGTPAGDYPDNDKRFVFFARAVLEAAQATDFRPDIIHVHDWQAALIPLYLKTLYRKNPFFSISKSVLTIHNLGYQGLFPKESLPLTGLGWEFFNPDGVEFWGKVNFLKAGIIGADMITTVSPTYAKEILTPEQGFGLDGLLRKRQANIRGILNGLDYTIWDPEDDSFIPKPYSFKNLTGKRESKKALLKECGFENAKAPIASFVGRLSWQKGVDMLLGAAQDLTSWGLHLAILGTGDEGYNRAFAALSKKLSPRMKAFITFDEKLSRLIYAGSDIFLMPSRYEPCGLGQMISMHYGTPPVARKTGGLADTIADYSPLLGKGTGFLFEEQSPAALKECLRSALLVYAAPGRWEEITRNSMRRDFSWRNSARNYIELYRELAADASGRLLNVR
jgi:starch synthase